MDILVAGLLIMFLLRRIKIVVKTALQATLVLIVEYIMWVGFIGFLINHFGHA